MKFNTFHLWTLGCAMVHNFCFILLSLLFNIRFGCNILCKWCLREGEESSIITDDVCVCVVPDCRCVTCQCHTSPYFVCLSEKWERVLDSTPLRGGRRWHKLRTQNSMNAIGHCRVPSIRIQPKMLPFVCLCFCFCTLSRLHCCISIARNMRSVGQKRVFFFCEFN